MNYKIQPLTQVLSGRIRIPASKSHTLRAIFLASLAQGQSDIYDYLPSPDTEAMIQACRQLGAVIEINDTHLKIMGVAGQPHCPDNVINVGNSGQVLRFVAAIGALLPTYTILTGDDSVRHNRPMQALLEGLTGLGAFAISTKNDGHAPVVIRGPVQQRTTQLSGIDSQPVTALLLLSIFLPGKTTIHVIDPGELPWINLTLHWLDRLGVKYQHNNFSHYVVEGKPLYEGFTYHVPGDWSTAAFPTVAALLTHSEIVLENLDPNDVQGDKELFIALQNMGANLEFDAAKRLLTVKKSPQLTGGTLNINNYVDAITILAVLGCHTSEPLTITGAAIARQKESNRLEAIATELTKMGANIKVTDDGLVITPQALYGTEVQSHHDHRIAMSLAIAGLMANSATHIHNTACVAKTYPDFALDMAKLGMSIQQHE